MAGQLTPAREEVAFTKKQHDYLTRMFPEQTSKTLTNDELRYYMGQRSLVQFIGSRIQRGNE